MSCLIQLNISHPAGRQLMHLVGDHRLHLLQVALERGGRERRLQDPAVVAVLVEVHQHDAAMEERADEVAPRRTVGERLVLVHEDLLPRRPRTR